MKIALLCDVLAYDSTSVIRIGWRKFPQISQILSLG